jgi:hypothetical protein
MAFLPMERILISAELRLKPEADDVAQATHSAAAKYGAPHSATTHYGATRSAMLHSAMLHSATIRSRDSTVRRA